MEFIWSGEDASAFEQWIYEQNSTDFETLLGENNYVELISYDYKRKTIKQIKQFIKSVLTETLTKEFEEEFGNRIYKPIKGHCIKKFARDYYEEKERKWDVVIGKEYEFIIINSGLTRGNHSALVNYVDRTNDFQPSGFIPMELFDIDLKTISEIYQKVVNTSNETTIEIKAFSGKHYKPTQYSFWEDFYNDDEKAVKVFNDTIRKLGIKNVW